MKSFELKDSEIIKKKENRHKISGLVYYDLIYEIELTKERKFELLKQCLPNVISLISNDIYNYIANDDNLIKKYLK